MVGAEVALAEGEASSPLILGGHAARISSGVSRRLAGIALSMTWGVGVRRVPVSAETNVRS